jgi:ABC-2 type transport system permease protein
MNTHRIRTIIDKEWAEVFKNRMVLFTIIFLPLIFTALPLVMLGLTGKAGGMSTSDAADVPAMFASACGALTGMECMQVYLLNQFLIMFMMMPLIIPMTIAAYSIVGEKTTRSLEPLLATPISTFELLAGKSLAAAIPAVVVSWAAFILFILLLPVIGVHSAVRDYILGPTWIVAVMIIGPLMAIASVNFAVIVSSRVNDPRAAEQISAVLIIPLMAVLFGQLAGLLVINLFFVLGGVVFFVLIDLGLLRLGAALFQREAILTRWK